MSKVFVHGNPEVDAIWRPLVDALADVGVDDVVLLSPPGFGAPTPADWDATMASYVGWLVGELESLSDSGSAPIDLVGHDWGAGHVFGVVAERPDLLRSWSADVAGLLHPDYVWHDMAQAWQTPDVGEQVIEAMVAMSVAEREAAFADLGLPPDVLAAVAAGVDAEMGTCILALYRDATPSAMVALGDRVAAADRPHGLVIDATGDPYVSHDLSNEVAARLDAETLVLDGNGHWWMVEDPAGAAAGLAAFWSQL